MSEQWIVPAILAGLAVFLLLVWIPVVCEGRRNRKKQ